MKTAMFAAGLVATASAAHLRSGVQIQRAATHAGIAALAEKYDCVTGERGLEDVLDEIASKNVASKAELEKTCAASMDGYNGALATEQQSVNTLRVDARPAAEATEARKIKTAKDNFKRLNEHHEQDIAKKLATKISMQSAFDSQDAQYNGEGGEVDQYNGEVASVAADRATAAGKYRNAMAAADKAWKEGKASEDGLRNGKIAAAATKTEADDKTCKNQYTTRQGIADEDQAIVTELSKVRDELEKLSSRGTSLIETHTERMQLRAKAHANYNELLDAKKNEIVQWNDSCEAARGDYNDELATSEANAQTIRDDAGDAQAGSHADVFATEFGDATKLFEEVVTRNAGIVQTTTQKSTDADSDYLTKNADHLTKKDFFETESATVKEERENALSKQTDDNADIEQTRLRVNGEHLSFHDATVTKAKQVNVDELATCKSALEARTKLIQGDEAALTEIKGLLAKLDRCQKSSDVAFVEIAESKAMSSAIEAMSCAQAQERYNDVKGTSFLEMADPATTGTLNDFGVRVTQEHSHAKTSKEACDTAANGVLSGAEGDAAALLTKNVAESNSQAEKATAAVNAQYEKKTTELDAKFKAAEDPHAAATTANGLALAHKTTSNKNLASALATQESEVGTATEIRDDTIATSTKKRTDGIAKDNKTADQMVQDAIADHKEKTDAENSKCKAENTALDMEKSKLNHIIARMTELQKAHQGLSGTDETSITDDVNAMQKALDDERSSSEVDKTACLKRSDDLEKLTVKNANSHYDTEEGKLNAENTRATGVATDDRDAKKIAHDDREKNNNSMYHLATAAFGTATNNKNSANNAHTSALAEEKKIMENEHASLLLTEENAPIERDDEIDNVMEQARVMEEAASDAHTSETNLKEAECEANRAILKDERKTLLTIRHAIQKLVNVRDDSLGWDADETSKTTLAPTWERL